MAAAPDIAPAVIRAAGRLNDAKDEVDGRCVRARVRATEPAAVATLLSGKGVAGVTERPDVWIPDSSLWTKLVGSSDRPGAAGSFTDLGGMASSPIVLAMPRGLATQLRNLGAPEQPSWKELLAAAGASDGGQDPDAGDGVIPARLFRLQVPDPDRSATGMGSLMLAGALLARLPGRPGAVRRRGPDDPRGHRDVGRGGVRRVRQGRHRPLPRRAGSRAGGLLLQRAPSGRAGRRGVPGGGDDLPRPSRHRPVRGRGQGGAARLLGRALSARATRDDVQRLGFRTPGGAAPAAFSPGPA
ncbi:substrate-binding domain-containing protein [Actinomadura madurae]|uniref:substrate-binding domain-containing protein n=1 Tax=Actinomadura madurae TaxID=1993 RepID=UPI0020D23F31|nr:substrate-binding domain-containing protein [Actinomadura madurae]MCQ0011381.1 substrate-binding domain-containing protein [Actinomadura madurae]